MSILVNVVFSVLDKRRKLFWTSAQNEVSLVEDDATQKVTNFTREAGGPSALAVLIDTSNSIRAQFKVEQRQPSTSSTRRVAAAARQSDAV